METFESQLNQQTQQHPNPTKQQENDEPIETNSIGMEHHFQQIQLQQQLQQQQQQQAEEEDTMMLPWEYYEEEQHQTYEKEQHQTMMMMDDMPWLWQPTTHIKEPAPKAISPSRGSFVEQQHIATTPSLYIQQPFLSTNEMEDSSSSPSTTPLASHLDATPPSEARRTWNLVTYDSSFFKTAPSFNARIRTRREPFLNTLDSALYVPLNYKLRVDVNNPESFDDNYLILTLRLCGGNTTKFPPQKAALTNVNESYAEFAPKFHTSQSFAKHHQAYYFEIDVSSRVAPLTTIAVLRSPQFKVYCRRPAKHTRSKNQRRQLKKFQDALSNLVNYATHALNEQEKEEASHLLQQHMVNMI